MKAIGVHVFAGGFTTGVKSIMSVDRQLEIHKLGIDTVTNQLDVNVYTANQWEQWPTTNADFLFGNPRCTGFSSTTTLMSHRGPDSPINKDIHDLCQYGVINKIPVIAWESVQQAYSIGNPLLKRLCDEYFIPSGYRVAHVFIRAADFGNSQLRRRYFFVAYRKGVFNAELFKVQPRKTIEDVIGNLQNKQTRATSITTKKAEYDGDCYHQFKPEYTSVIPHMPQGLSINDLFNTREEWFSEQFPELYNKALCCSSTIPFGISCFKRLAWNSYCPTLTSGCCSLIHPKHDRPLTIRELAALMGWPHLPIGPYPIQQIAKGVIPVIGQWIALMAYRCLTGYWGSDDWEYTNGKKRGVTGKIEKVFRLEQS